MSFTKEQLREQMLLYAVTDRHWLNGQTLYEQVEEALKGGATFIQLREKDLTEEEFLEEAKKIQQLCKEYRVPFIINDNVKLAKEIDADGVHVGQSDMEALDVRAQLGEDKIIGVSARTVEQALLAEKHGADYLGVGAVFQTGTKTDAREVEHLWAQIEKLRLEVERVETQLNTANICHCITSECYSLSLFREYISAVFRGIQRYLRRGNEQ